MCGTLNQACLLKPLSQSSIGRGHLGIVGYTASGDIDDVIIIHRHQAPEYIFNNARTRWFQCSEVFNVTLEMHKSVYASDGPLRR